MTRRQALQMAFMDIDEALCFSATLLADHKESEPDYYLIMSKIQGARWNGPPDYEMLGELLVPLQEFAYRIGASKIVTAIENYHRVQKQDFPEEPDPEPIESEDPNATGKWLRTMPKEKGIYWTYLQPPNKVMLVQIEDGYMHFLGTDDGGWEELPYQLFWSERLIPPLSPVDVLRMRKG
jgi:hypothetical protein